MHVQPRIMNATLTLMTVCVLGAQARASQVTLTEVDGSAVVGELVSLSTDAITLQIDGEEHATPLADLAKVTFHRRLDSVRVPRPCLVYPKSGGQLSGSILESVPDGIIMKTSFADQLRIPFTDMRAMTFQQESWPVEITSRYQDTIANAQAGEDILLARSEKAADGVSAIHGALVELNPTGGDFRFNDRTRRVKLEKIYALVFATSLESQPLPPASLQLVSGDVFGGSLDSIQDGRVTFTTGFNQTIACPIDDIDSITLNNDRIVYLDALEPQSQTSTSVLYDGWSVRKNRNVFNQPMRMDGTTFDHGIGVHANSEVQYRLAGAYQTFAAKVGLDDAVRPGGSVIFKIVVDGKVAFDSEPVTGADRALPINVSVVGAEWMTLVVEPAEHADIGDWANWGAARLIKPKTQS